MTDRRARATKADITRAIKAAQDAGASMAVEIKPDGTILMQEVEVQAPSRAPTPRAAMYDLADKAKAHNQVMLQRLDHLRSVVYFIRGGDMVKIGYATRLSVRFSQLAVSSPVPLFILGAVSGSVADEKAMHARFRDYRMFGEWFWLTKSCLKKIDETLKEV